MREISIGKIYKHFKGNLYLVLDIVKDSEIPNGKMVIYRSLKDNNEKWARPYDMFNSLVDKEKYQDVEQTYRFEEVGESYIDHEIYENMKLKNLSEYACPYELGIRIIKEDNDLRPSFFRDIDRIIYSLAYTRYLNKTQVFTYKEDDHVSVRMTHVQFVSKIARTIGRALNLNEDLIEAAALGHDLGHTPFGHVGESILNKISLENNEGYFNHNIQSVRILMNIEKNGEGLNITLPVLDAIMCHNGEFALGEYHKCEKNKEEFLEEYQNSYQDKEMLSRLKPMTLEGCVVRISDMIAYLGKDIEDAVRLGLLKLEDIPANIKRILGTNNKEIVNTIILDIINNSKNKDYIKLSDEIFKAIIELKKFNYENIYYKALSEEENIEIEKMFQTLFQKYLNDLKNNNQESTIYQNFLNSMNSKYLNNSSKERIVIDYISGMTDEYLMKEYQKTINS